jgi:glycosyltransferase involved in cell wall biosynthesis
MDNIPKITVLMPVYNCENYILEAVKSILQQTYTNFEFLIIDDCSTDKTVEIIKSLNDDRIQLIQKPKNTGITESLNYGIRISKGEYIARMDGDDISLPTRFEKQVAFMEANVDVVVCGTAFEFLHNNFYIAVPENNDEIKVGLLQECKIGHPTVMMRTLFLRKNQLFYNTNMEPAEDYDLWVRMIHLGKFHNLQESLLKYRVHDEQVSSKRNQIQIETALKIKSNMLFNLDNALQANEIKAYSNLISNYRAATFLDFVQFLAFKKKLSRCNLEKKYFDQIMLLNFLKNLEALFFNYYFKNRSYYNWNILSNYNKIINRVDCRLKFNDCFKLIFKCMICYKVK